MNRIDVHRQAADRTRGWLSEAGVLALSIVGPAGAGKKTLIEALLCRPGTGVIVAGADAHKSAARLAGRGRQVVALQSAWLSAVSVGHAAAGMDLEQLDLLVIQPGASQAASGDADLGQHARVCVLSVGAGEDQVSERPNLVRGADLVVLNKTDFLPLARFDVEGFARELRRLSPGAEFLSTSAHSAASIAAWTAWVERRMVKRKT